MTQQTIKSRTNDFLNIFVSLDVNIRLSSLADNLKDSIDSHNQMNDFMNMKSSSSIDNFKDLSTSYDQINNFYRNEFINLRFSSVDNSRYSSSYYYSFESFNLTKNINSVSSQSSFWQYAQTHFERFVDFESLEYILSRFHQEIMKRLKNFEITNQNQ